MGGIKTRGLNKISSSQKMSEYARKLPRPLRGPRRPPDRLKQRLCAACRILCTCCSKLCMCAEICILCGKHSEHAIASGKLITLEAEDSSYLQPVLIQPRPMCLFCLSNFAAQTDTSSPFIRTMQKQRPGCGSIEEKKKVSSSRLNAGH